MSTLLQAISTAFTPLVEGSQAASPKIESSAGQGLREEISKIWQTIPSLPSLDIPPIQEDPSSSDTQAGKKRQEKNVEIIRGSLEVYSREIVVEPTVRDTLHQEVGSSSSARDKERLQQVVRDVQNRLNIALTLFEVVFDLHPSVNLLEPGALFIPLLEELVELLSVDTWRALWPWIEENSKRFTQNMPASRGKALPLLRIINAFLRFLPRTPEYLVFRGRIHHFASSVIGIAERSAVNFRGDYADVKTTWEEFIVAPPDPIETLEVKAEQVEKSIEADGDVKMEEKTTADVPQAKEQPAQDLYSTLWSLQQYFASPPLLGRPAKDVSGSTTWDDFQKRSDFVLPKLFEQTKKQVEMLGKEDVPGVVGSKRKRESDDEGFFHPRYLTPRRLFEHQLGDHGFRRQILSQYCILFQFLLNLTPASKAKQSYTGGMPKDFVIDEAKEKWIKSTAIGIRDDFKKMPGDGVMYEQTFMSIIANEHHYARWKNEQCPEGVFEKPAMERKELEESLAQWRKPLPGLQKWRIKLGTRALQNVVDQGRIRRKNLTAKPVKSWQEIGEELTELKKEEEIDPDNLTYYKEKGESLNWTALRLAAKTDLRSFRHLRKNRSVVHLQESIDNAIKEEAVKTEGEGGDVEMTPSQSQTGTPGQEENQPEGNGSDQSLVGGEVKMEVEGEQAVEEVNEVEEEEEEEEVEQVEVKEKVEI